MTDQSKVLLFTDLHILDENSKLIKKVLNFILETAKQSSAVCAINMGDTFHFKNKLHATELNMYRDFLFELTEIMPVYSIIGNHDWALKGEHEIHSLQGFQDISQHYIVDTSAQVQIDGKMLGMIPYCFNENHFDAIRAKIGRVDYLFGHFDVNGFEYGNGEEEKGSWSAEHKFSDVLRVFSGHYHKYQTRIVKNTEITFLGTSYTVDRGESDQKKYIGLFFPKTGELELVQTPFTVHKTERLKFGDTLPALPEKEMQEGLDFKIEIEGTLDQIKSYDVPKEYRNVVIFKTIQKKEDRLDISVRESKHEIVSKYVNFKLSKADGSGLDAEKLKEKGLKILQSLSK